MEEIYIEQIYTCLKCPIERYLRFYSGGTSDSSSQGHQQSVSSSSGSSTSSATPQMTPEQVLSMYGSALPALLKTTNTATNNSAAGQASNAAAQGGAAAVNAINLNGLSPGEAAATERSLNQSNTSTGNLGLLNPTNTISNAMNFGGAFNSKIPLMEGAVNAAAAGSNAANTTTGTTASLFNPVSSNANQENSKSNSIFSSASGSLGNNNGSSSSIQGGIGCFITTACCQYKGLKDDCSELTILRKFRDEHVPIELVKEYYTVAPKIVERVKGNNTILEYIWNTIQACIKAIKNEDYGIALNRYRMMVTTLRNITHV